jgi:hypothetical protein
MDHDLSDLANKHMAKDKAYSHEKKEMVESKDCPQGNRCSTAWYFNPDPKKECDWSCPHKDSCVWTFIAKGTVRWVK